MYTSFGMVSCSLHPQSRDEGWVCDVYRHLISVRTFGIMYDQTFSKLANHPFSHFAKKHRLHPQKFILSTAQYLMALQYKRKHKTYFTNTHFI